MSFSFGFYNSDNHDRRYNAVQMSMIFDGIIRDGVYATVGKCFVVEATDEEGVVVVPSGRAWFNHTWNYNDSDLKMNAPVSDLILTRIDAIAIDINSDENVRANTIVWVKGTPSETPTNPTLINTETHHQYPLCYIKRNPNTEIINQEDITNAVGTSECPFVTGILETISIDKLLIQWEDQWTQFIKKYEEDITAWTQAQQEDFKNMYLEFKTQMADFQKASQKEFTDWFADVQTVLDGDTAGELLNKINKLDSREEMHHYDTQVGTVVINTSDKSIISTTGSETISTNIRKNADGSTTILSTIEPTTGNYNYSKTVTIENTTTGKKITKDVVLVPKSMGGRTVGPI